MSQPACFLCGKLIPANCVRSSQIGRFIRRNYATKKERHALPLDMRNEFDFGPKPEVKRWFPKHMQVGMQTMREKFQNVDCVIEMHDARIPYSGRNPMLHQVFSAKPYVVLLNKCDLVKATKNEIESIKENFEDQGIEHVFFTQAARTNMHRSLKEVIPLCTKLASEGYRFNRETENEICIMVCGVPNVGKSSLITCVRKRNLGINTGASVGKSPGHTKQVSFKIKVSSSPATYLMDTPGVLHPKITDLDIGMKLAICNTIQDHVMVPSMVADYLLFLLNRKYELDYVDFFKLEKATDCVQTLLREIAKRKGRVERRRVMLGTGITHLQVPDYEYAARLFLQAFREGKIGRIFLDDV